MGASLGFIPGFLATVLSEDLDVSRGKIGLIVGIYFGATGIGSIPAGRFTDKFGARKVASINMLLVAGSSILIAIFDTYAMWIIGSLVGGMGYALGNTSTNVAIGHAVPLERRTLAMSVKTSGVPLMATIAAALAPWAANYWSWQRVLVFNALVASATAVLTYVFLSDDRSESNTGSAPIRLPKDFYWFGIAAFLLIGGSQPLYSWTVSYLEESLNAPASLSGGIMALVFEVIASSIFSGSMHHVSSITSTNIGFAPEYITAPGQLAHVISGKITSSPSPMPIASRAKCVAPVQLEVEVA